jgi:hypothetical protein
LMPYLLAAYSSMTQTVGGAARAPYLIGMGSKNLQFTAMSILPLAAAGR